MQLKFAISDLKQAYCDLKLCNCSIKRPQLPIESGFYVEARCKGRMIAGAVYVQCGLFELGDERKRGWKETDTLAAVNAAVETAETSVGG